MVMTPVRWAATQLNVRESVSKIKHDTVIELKLLIMLAVDVILLCG